MSNKVINQINDATIYKGGINITQNPEWADIYGKPSGLNQNNIKKWIEMASLWNGETGQLEVSLATKDKAGIVQIGEGIKVDNSGVISVAGVDVDIATETKAGIVKPSDDFDIAADGTLYLYKPISIASYSISPNLVEVGSTATEVTPTFTVNKEVSAKINGTTATSGTKITGSWTTNTNFELVVTDAKGKTASSTQTLQFGYYYYIQTSGSDYSPTESQIKAFSKSLATGKTKNYKTTTNGYVYLAIPSDWGTPSYKIGGFTYSFNLVKTLNVTTDNNTTSYKVYRSGSKISNDTTISIS